MVKQGARDERAIDGRHKSQRAYTCPFPFCCEPESSDAITENDGPNETIQQGRDACGPEWKMQFGQKEKAQTHDQVDNSCQQCEYALCRAKSEMIHGSVLPFSSGNATIIQQMGKKRMSTTLKCQPATHFVLRFASAGSKGSTLKFDPPTTLRTLQWVLATTLARLLTPSVSQDQRKCLLLRSQQARKVVLDLIPTGNGLRPTCGQPVGEVVPRTGFEPVIFALKGRCPRPLDERGSCNAALLQR